MLATAVRFDPAAVESLGNPFAAHVLQGLEAGRVDLFLDLRTL